MLTKNEVNTILSKLNREIRKGEEATLDALWSEHCSYKSSKRWFHLFNTESERVHLGIGEGAGLLDIGNGYVIGLGLESHNHPSAVDPFNGAATGVGGIIRDILSQGCRPVAVLDCLRFGLPQSSRQKFLLDQVVLGISSYGNCVGIPNLGGDIEFSPEFEKNPLVNAMCVGVAKKDEIIRSVAKTPGHKLLLYGSESGRDGIGGVTFASEELDDNQQESRGSVQIGDPLTEKILIDATLELRDKNLISGLQDLGGGGLVCAAVEMAEKGNTGVKLELSNVPLREELSGWEVLVSESQERMLAVVPPDNIDKVIDVIDKYNLNCAVVGEIIRGNTFRAYLDSVIEAELPVDFTINGFPEPKRELTEITPQNRIEVEHPDPIDAFIELLGNINIASKYPVYQQYDQNVQGNTVYGPGMDGGVIKLPNEKYLALAAGTNSYAVSLDPKIGSALSTLGVMRNVAPRGALPIGMVDSVNAGNPEKPDSYTEFVNMIRGIAEVSHKMSIPVVGGNVSLYNESEKNGLKSKILPSPFVGIAGLIENNPISPNLNDRGDIYLIGTKNGIIKGSQYGKLYGYTDTYSIDYDLEKELIDKLIQLGSYIDAATNVGKGGLLLTLAKWAINSKLGLDIVTEDIQPEYLFGEHTPRYLIQFEQSELNNIKEILSDLFIQKVASINISNTFTFKQSLDLSELQTIWHTPVKNAMDV